jgi:hypothetical protein
MILSIIIGAIGALLVVFALKTDGNLRQLIWLIGISILFIVIILTCISLAGSVFGIAVVLTAILVIYIFFHILFSFLFRRIIAPALFPIKNITLDDIATNSLKYKISGYRAKKFKKQYKKIYGKDPYEK